jgi:hypothetical protein
MQGSNLSSVRKISTASSLNYTIVFISLDKPLYLILIFLEIKQLSSMVDLKSEDSD